jgi:hypothetical protein
MSQVATDGDAAASDLTTSGWTFCGRKWQDFHFLLFSAASSALLVVVHSVDKTSKVADIIQAKRGSDHGRCSLPCRAGVRSDLGNVDGGCWLGWDLGGNVWVRVGMVNNDGARCTS